jgi:hypothetical protein
MEHYVIGSQTFNYLTVGQHKDGLVLTGETKEGLETSDVIQNPWYTKQMLPILSIMERRDSKDYPEGNNYFYRVLCSVPPIV